MCASGRPDEDGFGVRIFSGPHTDAYLQKADVGHRGYTLVIWRGRHVAEPTELTPDEASSYFSDVLRVTRAIEEHYGPLKMNLALLGNALPHLHTHVIPRYAGDEMPGAPPAFFARDASKHGVRPRDELERDAAALRALLR